MTPARTGPGVALPETTEALIGHLGAAENPAVVGGGTMIIPQLVRGRLAPDLLVDLCRLPDAARLRVDDGTTSLGPMVTYTTLIRDTAAPPLLRHIAFGITGGPQIRNQGTVAGSACYANPASDVPAGLVVSRAVMRIAGPDGIRVVAAENFFRGAFSTVLTEEEALVGVDLPAHAGSSAFGYCKIKRSESSWPIATAAALGSGDGTVNLVVGAAVTRPVTITLLPEQAPPDLAVVDEAVDRQGATWWQDELADAGYRRRITVVALTRALASYRNRIVKRDQP